MKPRAAAVAATVALAGCGTTTGAPTPDEAIPGVDTVSLAAPQPIVTNTTGTSPAVPAWPATLAGGATDRDGTQIAGLVAEVDPDGQLLTLTLTTPDHRIEAVRTDRTWWARGGPADILADGAVNPHGWYQLDDLDDLDRIVPVGLGTLTDRLEVASRLEGSLTSHAGAVTVTVTVTTGAEFRVHRWVAIRAVGAGAAAGRRHAGWRRRWTAGKSQTRADERTAARRDTTPSCRTRRRRIVTGAIDHPTQGLRVERPGPARHRFVANARTKPEFAGLGSLQDIGGRLLPCRPMATQRRLGVLASGRGSNVAALWQAHARGDLSLPVALVVSNNSKAGVMSFAREHGIATAHISAKTHDDPGAALLSALRAHDIDVLVLAGYMKRVDPRVVAAYEGRSVNIHPAPLPQFGGPGMFGQHVHAAVLAAGARHSGPTVHRVTAQYDEGEVLAHRPVPVRADDDVDALAQRVLAAEHALYWETIERCFGGGA